MPRKLARQIAHSILLDIPTERAYELISQPEYMTRWFCDSCEPLADGFRALWQTEEGHITGFDTRILSNQPGRMFAYEATSHVPIITRFVLTPVDGGCRLDLLETLPPDLPDLEMIYEEHFTGWQWFLQRLQTVA
ncbi:MAG: SRPBCC family protein [Chloroflexota bacterium]